MLARRHLLASFMRTYLASCDAAKYTIRGSPMENRRDIKNICQDPVRPTNMVSGKCVFDNVDNRVYDKMHS